MAENTNVGVAVFVSGNTWVRFLTSVQMSVKLTEK